MRIPVAEHTDRPWRIHEITPDFRVEDVWDLPVTGGPDEFPDAVRQFATGRPDDSPSPIARFLFAVRWKLGALLGWDREDAGVGGRVHSLRERLPADLRDTPVPTSTPSSPFTPLYLTDDEYAAEIANRTMHGVMHLAAIPDGTGGFRARMTVLVRPNGRFGNLYMAAIKPFRYLIVYPALMRQIERESATWDQRPERTG